MNSRIATSPEKLVPTPTPSRPPEYWDAQYAHVREIETHLRAVLPSLTFNPLAVNDARAALANVGKVAEFVLREQARSEQSSAIDREADGDGDEWLLKVEEAAARMSVGKSLLYELIKQGVIPFVMVGTEKRVPVSKVKHWIAANTRYGG